MSEIKTFFRHCPYCGRRFEIRLVSRKAIDENPAPGVQSRTGTLIGSSRAEVELKMGTPVLIAAEDFQYEYRCGHCGYQWTEIHEKLDEGLTPRSYTGD